MAANLKNGEKLVTVRGLRAVYDALKQDNKADKTYVDKKVADLVNGAPEQLDTLQELSKALNNDKDYATTVNNALAEKLGRTEKAVSAGTADDSDKLDGHHYQDIIKKIPSRSNLPLQYEQKKDETNQKNYNYIYPDNGFSSGSPDAATRIELYGRMGYWNADGANLTLTGADDSNGFLFRLRPMSQQVDDSPAVIPELVGSIDYSTSTYKYSNPKLTWTDDKGVIADLAGAGIVSQQLESNGYIKYGNGLAIIWGEVDYHVSKWENSLADATNKQYEYFKSEALPVTVNRIYRAYVSATDIIGKGYGEHASICSTSGSYISVTMHTIKPVTGNIQVNYFLIGSWK